MPQPILYIAITNHGFGHATRTASIVADLQRAFPELLVIMATTAPRWLLESYIQNDFIHRPRSFDVGVLQRDSLNMDKPGTLEKLQHIRTQAHSIIASEVSFIQQNRVGLVLADIPPLTAKIARAAKVPCWMMSNFGWDFIYRAWGDEFSGISDWIAECFGECDRLFRLPFHEPMSSFPVIEDIGLAGGSPRYPSDEIRSLFGITTPPEKTILLTFGGLGLAKIPYENLQRFPDWQFISFDQDAPKLPNLLVVTEQKYRPVDVMPLCSRVVSKPGYGTFAEACRLNIPIFSITREDFAEAEILLEGLQDYSQHQIISHTDFFEGDWDFLRSPMNPPRQSKPLALDGNQTIVQAIIDHFQS